MTAALHLPDKQDWTVDDLASLPEDLRYELIDGRLILPSPTGIHQELGVEVLMALRVHCPSDFRPFVDLSLKIDFRSEPRPDVVVINRSWASVSPVPAKEALLAVEIISPDSTYRDMIGKAKVYAAAGIPHYWVINPLQERGIELSEFRPGAGGHYEIMSSTTGIFTTDVPYPVTIDLPALTALRQGMLEDADGRA